MRKGRVYKLINDVKPSDIYIGSTNRDLRFRMYEHKSRRRSDQDRKIYDFMNGIGFDHFDIELIEEIDYNDVKDLRAREDHYIGILNPSLNTKRSIANKEKRKRSKAIWRLGDQVTRYNAKYRKKNIEYLRIKDQMRYWINKFNAEYRPIEVRTFDINVDIVLR